MKPGGRLAYITCSIFPRENQRQVEAFLAGNTDFSLVEPAHLWRSRFPEAVNAARLDESGIVLSPATTGTDGFFFAALQRRPA